MTLLKYARPLKKLGTATKCILLMGTILMPFLILSYARHGETIYKNGNERGVMTAKMPVLNQGHLTNNPSKQLAIGERFSRRRLALQDQCNEMREYFEAQNSENAVKEHLTIDKKHKIVYCAIEKIGCTFWKRVFQIISGFRNVSDPFQIQGIRAYEGYLTAKGLPFDRIHYILKHSTNFMFVREPYERLLSGYVDKLFAPNAAYWAFIGTFITQNIRTNASEVEKQCGHDVTFAEFVKYFIYSQHNNMRRDAHFVPNFEHCRPCEIDYKYIGKLETFEEDTLFLLKELKLDDKVRFNDFQKETEKDAIVDAADYVFSMKRAISKCMSLNKALFRAYRKLQIRGIISKDIHFPFPQESNREITINEYKQALLTAHAQSGSYASRKANRKEAFQEAYATLPQDLLMRLKDELSIDARLFGYESLPQVLKDSSSYTSSFKYFNIDV